MTLNELAELIESVRLSALFGGRFGDQVDDEEMNELSQFELVQCFAFLHAAQCSAKKAEFFNHIDKQPQFPPQFPPMI